MSGRETTNANPNQLNVSFKCSNQIGMSICPECNRAAGMLSPEEAAAIAEVDTRTIYRWLEAAKLHFIETSGGSVLVCLNTLSQEMAKPAEQGVLARP